VRAVLQNLVAGLQAFGDLRLHVVHCHADIVHSATLREGGTTIHYVAMPRRRVVPNTLGSILRVERLLRQLEPDVVNTHAAHYTVGALRAGFPAAYTIHGVVHREAQIYQSSLRDRLRFLLEAQCDRYAVARVGHLVAISPYVLEEYEGRTQAAFHRIDNPLDGRLFDLVDEEQAGQLLYAGTIDERKNVLGLLRAIDLVRESHPEVCLRIAGRTTNDAYCQKVHEYVAQAGLEPCVDFLGLLNSSEMLQEYARCAALVLASRQETAPMAVTEAMAAGKPVVATRVGGLQDLVEDERSGLLVAPGDPEDLARRIVDLLSDASLRRRMGRRARELADRFRVERVAAQYRGLYYELAAKEAP
jgi:glycosyltransferase involved in cell wall biosynthesis